MVSKAPHPNYRLSVRQAADFLCQTGDLSHSDRPIATAMEGQDAHRRIQAAWPAGIDKEVALKWCFKQADFKLSLNGRIDGLQVQGDEVRFLEIKTLRHPPEFLPDAVKMRHRLQVLLYAHLWQLQNQTEKPERCVISLIYFNTLEQKISEQAETFSATELNTVTRPLIKSLLAWFADLLTHRQYRDTTLRDIAFPFQFRAGQRAFAAQVFRTVRDQQQALIEAPTGSGKSIATLFPALKTIAEGHIDQIIISTAKNSTQQATLDSLCLLNLDQSSLRVLQLTAKEKICVRDSVCNWADCPRQSGFFMRLDAARQACLDQGFLSASVLHDIALQHEICPHGLQSHLQPWCDVLTGDYNYVFSPTVRSEFLFSFNRTALLVDEAHNLPDRARELFSARLDSELFFAVLKGQTTANSPLGKATRMLLTELQQVSTASESWSGRSALAKKLEQFVGCAEHWLLTPHDLLSGANQENMRTTETALQQARQWLLTADKAEQDFVCFDARFNADDESGEVTNGDEIQSTLSHSSAKDSPARRTPKLARKLYLRCLSPARLLRPYFSASTATILFSATLTPPGFFQQLLGLSNKVSKHRLTSTFDAEQSAVIATPYINMRSKVRAASFPAIVELIATTYSARPGNYWVYTPSFDYQARLAAVFAESFPDIEVVSQQQRTQTGQSDFLDRFTPQSRVVGFTILGGVFGEGVDLPGDRLIGAIILGPGLPQMSMINERIAGYFKGQGLDGFAYAYQLPGWQKVVQAAGRVIRTETDRGVVILADDRFTQASYKTLMPAHWQLQTSQSDSELGKALANFWQYQDGFNRGII